jgi:hypothetical protein
VLLSSGDSFPHLIQKRSSQLGFVTYLLYCPLNLSFILPFKILALCFFMTSRIAFRVAYFINLISNTIQTARINFRFSLGQIGLS